MKMILNPGVVTILFYRNIHEVHNCNFHDISIMLSSTSRCCSFNNRYRYIM
ncbi:S-adenosyl-L-methionine-dependent methyltransferase [Moniliophthora roreri]|nr:S-adenosyl-L-methionine-dependent methyltransferase [Moniliophthora roreri]KAI3619551.1 S-adenosyl-L-methionine-dependent methyltransferase [Moniliophthora roreri]